MEQVIETYIDLNAVNPELNKDLEMYVSARKKPAAKRTAP